MRATERLLEVIETYANELLDEPELTADPRPTIAAVAELRRRGDTLVRRDDLRHAMEMAKLAGDDVGVVWMADPKWMRLENAIGGKLR
jgi:hypothetical protein